jgi:hypothetical protein
MRLFFFFLINSFFFSAQVNFNDFVVKEANKYQGGTYVWKGSGCPIDIVHKDQTLLTKSAVGTHCSGFTFTIVFNTLKEHQLLDAFELNQLKDFLFTYFSDYYYFFFMITFYQSTYCLFPVYYPIIFLLNFMNATLFSLLIFQLFLFSISPINTTRQK